MLTLITGTPGSGKSAAMVELMHEAAKKGRACYVDGVPDLKVPHIPLEEPLRWPELVPDGSLVVLDEVQRIWRPAGAGAKVPESVAALETHRHRGLDFILITQHPNLLHQNVRRLVGRHIHLRDLGILGRWWYEWPEAANPENYKTAVVKKRYRLPKAIFALYKSASLHVKPQRKVPGFVFVLGLAAVAMLTLGVKAYDSITDKLDPAKNATKGAAASLADARVIEGLTGKPLAPTAASGAAVHQPAVAPAPGAAPESLRVVGCVATAKRCSCFTDSGWPVQLAWDVCQASSRGYGGVVALAVGDGRSGSGSSVPAVPADRASGAVVADGAGLMGFDAGDFRQRAPGAHITAGGRGE